ncbi:endospore germination permease [Paenibacillus frigoriresistens]|uniref:GerAB/ArcD/ProY family transporter n=1 Tax=Paenibacillus alginolyticus TaxID=59839 RepID=UPI00156379A2|nr:endospore germination permease [Paenibacillus frigoriresistens]NRF93208.1 endospore germination permease [Paenibacillus frigoriresistens]
MKISGLQMFWMMATLEFGMTLLLSQSPAIAEAKQDAWISFIIAGVAAIMLTFVSAKLSLLYPHQTFIQYSQTILGKWLGKIIVIPYFIQWFSAIGVILRDSSDFILMTLFHKTPLIVLVVLMLYLIVYVTYQGGIEGIARCSEVIGPIIFLVIILTLILNYNNIEWKRILPIYADSGWMSILKGGLSPVSFFGESVSIMMLICFMAEPSKGVSRTIWGVGFASFFTCISTLAVLMVFGSGLTAKMWYPYFEMVRYISVMEFIQNIEILVTVIWMFSVFIKLSVYLFITSYGAAQWLNIKDWKKVIWFVALGVVPLAMIYKNIDTSSINYVKKYWIPYVFPINMVGIPLLLWIVGSIRKNSKEHYIYRRQ